MQVSLSECSCEWLWQRLTEAAGVRVWQVMSRPRARGAGQLPLEGASIGYALD